MLGIRPFGRVKAGGGRAQMTHFAWNLWHTCRIGGELSWTPPVLSGNGPAGRVFEHRRRGDLIRGGHPGFPFRLTVAAHFPPARPFSGTPPKDARDRGELWRAARGGHLIRSRVVGIVIRALRAEFPASHRVTSRPAPRVVDNA